MDFVDIVHEDGREATVTEEAYNLVWSKRGWTLKPERPNYTTEQLQAMKKTELADVARDGFGLDIPASATKADIITAIQEG